MAKPRLPAVLIRLELEAAPKVLIDALTEGESLRLEDWVSTHPDLAELVCRALELADEAKAA